MSDGLDFRIPRKKRAVDSHGSSEKPMIKKKKQEETVICIESDDDDDGESNFRSFSQSTADQSSPAGLGNFGGSHLDHTSQSLASSPGLGLTTQPSPTMMNRLNSTGVNKLTTTSPNRAQTKHLSVTNSKKPAASNRVSLSPMAGDSLANIGEATTKAKTSPPPKPATFRLTKQKSSMTETANATQKTKPKKQKKRKAEDSKTRTKQKSAVEPLIDDCSFLSSVPEKVNLEDCLKKFDDDDDHDDWLDDNPLGPSKKPNIEMEKLEAKRPATLSDAQAHKTTMSVKEVTERSQKKEETSKPTSSRVEANSEPSTLVLGDAKQTESKKKKQEKKGTAATSNKQQQQQQQQQGEERPIESKRTASKTSKKTSVPPNRADSKVLEVESASIGESEPATKVKKKKAAPISKAKTKTTETVAVALSSTESNKTGERTDTTNKTVPGTESQKGKATRAEGKKKQSTKAQATFNAKSSEAEKPSCTEQTAAPKPPKSKVITNKSKAKAADGVQVTTETDQATPSEETASLTTSKAPAVEAIDDKDKGTAKKVDKKEKLKAVKAKAGTLAKKKKTTFQDQVLRQMVFTCKPYTTASLAKELKVTEQQLNFTILSMLDKGLVIQKEFSSAKGRTKNLIWANLESKAKEAIPLDFSPTKYQEAHQELALLSKQEKDLLRELENVNSLPCNKDLSAQVEKEEDALAQLKQKLEDTHARVKSAKTGQPSKPKPGIVGRFLAKPKSEAELARERCPRRMRMRINAMRQEWKARKDKCKDFVDTLADAMEKKPKDIWKILDVETDEDAGVTMPPKYQIDP